MSLLQKHSTPTMPLRMATFASLFSFLPGGNEVDEKPEEVVFGNIEYCHYREKVPGNYVFSLPTPSGYFCQGHKALKLLKTAPTYYRPSYSMYAGRAAHGL
ncbi:hypothetical protein TWF703_002362 [Orbilia oligospora]|uniref:Uncharacterized protein n=1 Tax=Orbilia oligospora TaxID=2813651 RepID=A0A7C8JJR8_ORBOL|nr:hypothetical protein TWF703_002362 [Orbilia oligospora]